MATFQDPYANADYIATLLSGQVSGGYLQKEPSEATHGFWKATSTNLGLNFSASAITGVSYTPNQSAGTVGRLQFSTDGSNVKAIDGSNIAVGAYDFDLLGFMDVNDGDDDLDDMWTSGMTFSVWIRPDGGGTSKGRIWDKGQIFWFSLFNETSSKYKINFRCGTQSGAAWVKTSTNEVIFSDKWNHV